MNHQNGVTFVCKKIKNKHATDVLNGTSNFGHWVSDFVAQLVPNVSQRTAVTA